MDVFISVMGFVIFFIANCLVTIGLVASFYPKKDVDSIPILFMLTVLLWVMFFTKYMEGFTVDNLSMCVFLCGFVVVVAFYINVIILNRLFK